MVGVEGVGSSVLAILSSVGATCGTVSVAGAVTLYLFLVPAGALILLVTLVSLLQLYQPKLLPGMVLPLGLKKLFVYF